MAGDDTSVDDRIAKESKELENALQEKAKQTRADIKEAVDPVAQDAKETANNVINSVKGPLVETVQSVSDVMRRAGTDEGTALRGHIAEARKSLNANVLFPVKNTYLDAKASLKNLSEPVRDAQKQFGGEIDYLNDFRRRHPETFYGSLAAGIALPSLLFRGKWAMIRNTVLVTGLVAGAAYAHDQKPESPSSQ